MFFKAFVISMLWLPLWGFAAEALYLTFSDDPSSSMTVIWIEKEEKKEGIDYQKLGDEEWQKSEAKSERLVGSNWWVYKTYLSGLEEDSVYQVKVDGKKYLFHTLPKGLKRPLKIVIGGDAYLKESLFKEMNQMVAAKRPDFVIMGGDIAYTEGLRHCLKEKCWQADRWVDFLRIWSEQLVTPEGHLIPIVPVLGNHDVKEGFDDPRKAPVLLYQLFAFPQDRISYRTLCVGGELCFLLLDSGHTYPVAGPQTEWLESALQEKWRYKIPIYHIAAYPSVYSFDHGSSSDIRIFWLPLFEKYGVKFAIENDNHSFKRTHPLKDGKIDPEGIVFLGDGSWGVPPRKPKALWFLAKSAKTNCIWQLTLTAEKCLFEAFEINGRLIDSVMSTVSEEAVSSVQ